MNSAPPAESRGAESSRGHLQPPPDAGALAAAAVTGMPPASAAAVTGRAGLAGETGDADAPTAQAPVKVIAVSALIACAVVLAAARADRGAPDRPVLHAPTGGRPTVRGRSERLGASGIWWYRHMRLRRHYVTSESVVAGCGCQASFRVSGGSVIAGRRVREGMAPPGGSLTWPCRSVGWGA